MEGERNSSKQAIHDRVVAGMCHRLNSQLAAANGYVFLLGRKEGPGQFDEALRTQMDEIARSIHLLRSICVDDEPRPTPVTLSQIAETATDIMEHHPQGPVRFRVSESSAEAILRVDWARALRTFVTAGAWLGREVDGAVEVEVGLKGEDEGVIRLGVPAELPPPDDGEPLPSPPERWGLRTRSVDDRAVEIELLD